MTKKGEEAEALFKLAASKYAEALALNPNDDRGTVALLHILIKCQVSPQLSSALSLGQSTFGTVQNAQGSSVVACPACPSLPPVPKILRHQRLQLSAPLQLGQCVALPVRTPP